MPTEINPASPAMTDAEAEVAARRIIADFATNYRDDSPVPTVGTAPPVPQPGRPPMSQRAVDLNTTILTSSVLTAVVGGSATSILWASGHADPAVVAIVFGAPTALVLALGRLVKRAKGALPAEIHQHFNGPVIQDHRDVRTKNIGVWARTNNQQ